LECWNFDLGCNGLAFMSLDGLECLQEP
jgi:hypothetical protein